MLQRSLLLTLALLAVALGSEAAPIAEFDPVAITSSAVVGPQRTWAQTFDPAVTDSARQIELRLVHSQSFTPVELGNVTVELRTTETVSPTDEWDPGGSPTLSAVVGPQRSWAQTFDATATGLVSEIELTLVKNGSFTPAQLLDITIQIRSGGPTGTVLRSITVPGSTLPDGGIFDPLLVAFALGIPVALSEGQTYAIVVTTNSTVVDSPAGPYFWAGTNNGGYSNGENWLKDDTPDSQNPGVYVTRGDDLGFRVKYPAAEAPSDTVLGSVTVAGSTLPSGLNPPVARLTLPAPVPLSTGQRYAVVVSTDSTIVNNPLGPYFWSGTFDDQYGSGEDFLKDDRPGGSGVFAVNGGDRGFRILPATPILELADPGIDDSCMAGGDGDGLLEPGERVLLSPLIQENGGTLPATGVSGVLSTLTADVNVLDPLAAYPTIPLGGSASSSTPFTVEVTPSVGCTCPAISTVLYGADEFALLIEGFQFDTGTSLSSAPLPEPPSLQGIGALALAMNTPTSAFFSQIISGLTIAEIDPATGALIFGPFPTFPPTLPLGADGLAVVDSAGGVLAAADTSTGLIALIDTTTGFEFDVFPSPEIGPAGLAGGNGRLFIGFVSGNIYELDPFGGGVPIGFFPSVDLDGDALADPILGLAFDGTYLFASSLGTDVIAALDPDTGAVLAVSGLSGGGFFFSGLGAVTGPPGTPCSSAGSVDLTLDVNTDQGDFSFPFSETLGSGGGCNVPDADGDGWTDCADNCPTPNPSQIDTDGDGLGDACDPDDDNDGLSDVEEGMVGTNPLLPDTDGDGLSDFEEVNVTGTNPLVDDTDGDGALDGADNCPFIPGAQTNSDSLPAGDICQCGDVDDNGVVNSNDVTTFQEYLVGTEVPSFHTDRCRVTPGVGPCGVGDILQLRRHVGLLPANVGNYCAAYTGP